MTYGSFKHFKRPVFRTDISNHNWDFLSSSKDPNELWSEWKSNFLAIADKNVPIRTKRVRSQKSPWITADLKKLMHGRDIMKIKAINSNDPHDWAFTPQNVISTQNVITLTQNVIKFSTQNVIIFQRKL